VVRDDKIALLFHMSVLRYNTVHDKRTRITSRISDVKLNLSYLFVSRHEVHSINTHTASRRSLKTDKRECFTRHWFRRNHRVTDTFCNCVEGRTTQGYRYIL